MTDIRLLIVDVDGTLTDGGVYISESGESSKKFNVKDGMGIRLAMKAGIEVGIISHSNTAGMITARAKTLNLKYVYVGIEPKLHILNRWMEKLNLTLDQVAFMGDDVNDLDLITAVGLAACPADAMAVVKAQCDYVMQHEGGKGAVREFIDTHLLA